ncbi:hypothetical protein CRENBAI_001037 [Crenichthys baileyi]|uniref:Uncharacterized protein n=1 Tax=Crenichthys baileyi TaxID=28760 RepID=A0AAV9RVS6_9TELE
MKIEKDEAKRRGTIKVKAMAEVKVKNEGNTRRMTMMIEIEMMTMMIVVVDDHENDEEEEEEVNDDREDYGGRGSWDCDVDDSDSNDHDTKDQQGQQWHQQGQQQQGQQQQQQLQTLTLTPWNQANSTVAAQDDQAPDTLMLGPLRREPTPRALALGKHRDVLSAFRVFYSPEVERLVLKATEKLTLEQIRKDMDPLPFITHSPVTNFTERHERERCAAIPGNDHHHHQGRRWIHLRSDLPAVMAKFSIKPELTFPEVLTRAFLAAMFYKSKKENLLPLPGEKREHDDPYHWAYMLSDGKVLRHIVTLGGFDPHLTSSEVLRRSFLLAFLHIINVDARYSIHVLATRRMGHLGLHDQEGRIR